MKAKLFALVSIACLIVACNPDEKQKDEPQKVAFHKGDVVTLAVGTYANSDNAIQVTPRRVDGWVMGERNQEQQIVNGSLQFQWNPNDEIVVWVNGIPSVFTMDDSKTNQTGEYGNSTPAGTGKVIGNTDGKSGIAYFTGVMPANGTTFDVVCGPHAEDVACGQATKEHIPSTQTYHEDGIDRGIMRFEKVGCSLSDNIILLSPIWTAVRLYYTVQFTRGTEDQDITYHNKLGNFTFKAYSGGTRGTKDSQTGKVPVTLGTEEFSCVYDVTESPELNGEGPSAAIIFCVVVMPIGTYTSFTIELDQKGTGYGERGGQKVVEATCQSTNKFLDILGQVDYMSGFTMELGYYYNIPSPIELVYAYNPVTVTD